MLNMHRAKRSMQKAACKIYKAQCAKPGSFNDRYHQPMHGMPCSAQCDVQSQYCNPQEIIPQHNNSCCHTL